MAARRLRQVEKAPITKAARDLAKEINALQEQLEAKDQELRDERRRNKAQVMARRNRERENKAQQRRRLAARRGNNGEKVLCKGLNLVGKPCQNPPLLKERWDGPEEITGLYCLSHEPSISTETRIAFQSTGSAKSVGYKRVTPGEIAHELIQRTPQYFIGPYLKALGLELDPQTNELVKKNSGLKLYGYSRGGEVIKSPYPDYAGQVQILEKMLDRVYGKARQAVDLAAQNTTVSVNLTMDESRIEKVAQVLQQAGALPLPNGNGNGDSPKVIDAEAVELPMEEID